MDSKLLHVYPVNLNPIDLEHPECDSTTVVRPESDCALCRIGMCTQRLAHGESNVIVHAMIKVRH